MVREQLIIQEAIESRLYKYMSFINNRLVKTDERKYVIYSDKSNLIIKKNDILFNGVEVWPVSHIDTSHW